MKNGHIPESMARWAGVGLVLMAASQPSAAFGGAGWLENCATFTSCTAAVRSSTAPNVRYVFQPNSLSYPIPAGLNPAVNGVSETRFFDVYAVGSAAPSSAAGGVGNCGLFCAQGYDYLAPVPEPGPALMWLGGPAAVVLWSRHRLRPAEEGAWAHPQGGSFCIEPINSTGTTS